jgi:hypothetical protein
MTIGKHARALATALTLGSAILSLSTVQAEAREKPKHPPDNGVRCAITRSDGYIDFYLPGESVRDKFGQWKICGADGEWHSAARAGGGPGMPHPAGGGVYAP